MEAWGARLVLLAGESILVPSFPSFSRSLRFRSLFDLRSNPLSLCIAQTSLALPSLTRGFLPVLPFSPLSPSSLRLLFLLRLIVLAVLAPDMIFPYLSPIPPEMHSMREIIRCPAAYRIHGSFCPSVVLTEPSFDGSLIML